MNRKGFLTSVGAAMGLATVGVRPGRAADETMGMSEADLRGLGKTDLKICLQPGMFKLPPRDKTPNVSMVDAIDKIAYYGFLGVESLGVRADEIPAIKAKLDSTGVVWRCIGGVGSIGNPKKWQQGLGLSSEEEHEAIEKTFRDRVEQAKALGIKRVLCLTGQRRQDMPAEQQTAIVVKGLKRLAPIAEQNDVVIVLEILNQLINHPGYFLVYTPQGAEMMQAVGSPNVKVLYDIYHQQISEGNLINNIKKNIQYIGHFHIGDNPGRNYPTTGEINYRNVFKAIKDSGYDGYLAMECGYMDKSAVEIMKVMHDLTKFS